MLKLDEALKLLTNAKRPVILSGGGVLISNASKELTQLAKSLNIPVTTTMMGVGTYEEDDESNLGMLGVLGNYWANLAINDCDVLLAIGTRLNDRVIAPVKNCSKNAKIIHVDIDSGELSKNVQADIPIARDAKEFLKAMLNGLSSYSCDNFKDEKIQWINHINQLKSKKSIPQVQSDKLSAHTVLKKVYEASKKYNPIVCTEVGQHQLWTVQLFNFTQPRKLLTSGGLGTMGFGFPAAMGACLADRNQLVLNIAGDGSIQMNIQELATCIEYNLPVKVIIMNNGYLGMVRQWQEKLFEKRYSGTQISGPDFVKVAEAYGAKGIRVEKEEDIEKAIKEAIEYPGPVFVDIIIEPFEVVYPWVSQ